MSILATIEIVSATIITGEGTDKVYLHTKLTPCTWPFNDSPSLRVDCAKGTARKWLEENGFSALSIQQVDV